MKYLLLLLPFLCQAQELNIYLLGLTYHGKNIQNPEVSKNIPYKLDPAGNFTYHPELSLIYNNSKNYVYGFTYLKNTFFNDAYMFSVGKSHQLFKNTDLGFLGSIYIFQRENGIEEPYMHRTTRYGFLFLPWVFIQQKIPINSKTNLSLALTSNGFLNHLAFGTNIQL